MANSPEMDARLLGERTWITPSKYWPLTVRAIDQAVALHPTRYEGTRAAMNRLLAREFGS